jgi:Holliday junction resolvase RusA-like endonuclease
MEIRLPFPVSINAMYLNNRGRGRGRIASPELRAWKEQAGWELHVQKPKPVTSRCEIRIDLDDTRQGDADSRIKCVLDVLVTAGVIRDDRKKYVKRVSIGWEKLTGCRVAILPEDE